ncbi:MAG: hypothetical protein A2898_00665 [Candidatus Kerfeldbacteria bacterium RIFCSPLOWO2_01_FULL_48_11]|uniref:ParB-like N-terminal domain-containing protein n=1 Tax=Candidatus Kerfeldbacteria bacterium RIFCSPLOWO2_01_FULL_48_11 TaxID=1798543 RepID=A0A1G2B301_9BACT|nr:MAG: ParB-like protein partition protein [Parcubacteria group bacterium GW2011_GWA2_48_9]KKW16027.1 MAG: ParB-like protein partition protein [Parcubacteria group bacterium GW2011_GWC2_49_9]OGY83019.1 MAG: hypothetical protein A2898_00665 [Candidatus Kerfeldbacteria bacterium RIFCSPLOWO2_01_FULL_48_11]
MSDAYAGLGKGLEALIPRKISAEKIGVSKKILGPQERIDYVDPVTVTSNPHQPRKHFEHDAIEDLVNSIREHGILQPLIVSKTDSDYQLISGERRLRAAIIMGLKEVPVIIREASEQEKLALALIENIQRENLNPIERAWGYARLIQEFNLTQEEAAKKVGQPRASLTNSLRLLKLPEEMQKAVIDGLISEGHAKVLLGITDQKELMHLFRKIIHEELSVRTAEHHARPHRKASYRKAPRDPNITELEDQLRSALGTKVEIVRNGEQGTITIRCYSEEEFRALIEKLTRK